MAFVSPIPLFIASPRQALCRPTGNPRIALGHNPVACIPSETNTETEAKKPSFTVKRARNPQELHLLYSVWNEALEAEGMVPKAPDDLDSASSTVHILARNNRGDVVGAARLLRIDQNARLDRVCVLRDYRGTGVGRALVEKLLVFAAPVQGAVFVNATRGELGFFSILGFEAVGNDKLEDHQTVRTMVYRFPVCAPSVGCVGLHHTSIRVSDIERSLAFYGSVGFFVTEKFHTSSGQRACFVEGLGARLEFVESPDGRGGLSGVQGVPPAGFDRLVFNVTKACTDLESYLSHLQRRNGGLLEIAGPPARQIIGADVVSVASITDPDGLPIEFIRHEAQVPGELRTRVNW